MYQYLKSINLDIREIFVRLVELVVNL